MRKKEITQIYQIINKTFKDIALTFAGIALENNFKDELIADFANCLEDIYFKLSEMIIIPKIYPSGVFFRYIYCNIWRYRELCKKW